MAPSDEGAVSEADWGRENLEGLCFLVKSGSNTNIFSPSVAYGASSLIRGSPDRWRSGMIFDTLEKPPASAGGLFLRLMAHSSAIR